MPVHEFGQPAEMDKLCAIAETHNLTIVEDAACALGAEFNNKKVGTFGKSGLGLDSQCNKMRPAAGDRLL